MTSSILRAYYARRRKTEAEAADVSQLVFKSTVAPPFSKVEEVKKPFDRPLLLTVTSNVVAATALRIGRFVAYSLRGPTLFAPEKDKKTNF
jgi:hypothetical protein